MKLKFLPLQRNELWSTVSNEDWNSWTWQLRCSLKSKEQYAKCFNLNENEEAAFKEMSGIFQIQTTPYYASLADRNDADDPIRKILSPNIKEMNFEYQEMLDPLGENQNRPQNRIIHRYPDRCLFLITDICSVYCRYCTRKHFTAKESAFPKKDEYQEALEYLKRTKGIREVILSGGDPLSLSDSKLDKVLTDLREIEHIEIIRIGSRMPVVCPMRITDNLVGIIKKANPVFMMLHFNHPRELTMEAAEAISKFVDNGIPCLNQMVLLNGVNNHPAIVQALSRRLTYLRVKPYYMFQCDPSQGTDHLRTSIENSLSIQKELWGNLSGIAMPTLSVDIPNGGGKTTLVPNFEISKNENIRNYKGWDGVKASYISPEESRMQTPKDVNDFIEEWDILKNSKLDSF